MASKVREFTITVSRTVQPRQFESLKVELTEHHEVRKDYAAERDAAIKELGRVVDKMTKRELKRAIETNKER